MPNLFARAASLLLGDDPERHRRPRRPAAFGGARLRGPAGVGKSGPETAPPRPPVDDGVAVRSGFRTGRARGSRSGLLWRRIRSGDGRPLACRQSPGQRFRRRSLAAGSISGMYRRGHRVSFRNCRPGVTCWNGPVPAVLRAGLGPATREFLAAFSRPAACARMPNFHGTASRGLPIVARSCCRRICACAGRRTSKRSGRRFR